MKILDRYIIGKFLGTFFFIMSIIMAISIVFDVSEKLDAFLRTNPGFMQIVFNYYFNFVIYYSNVFSSLLLFISIIIFTSKLAQNSEIISMLSAGISYNRFLRPYFVATTILVLFSVVLNHVGVPYSNKVRLEFEGSYVRNPFHIRKTNLHREIEPGTIVYFERFTTMNKVGYNFSIEVWDGDVLKSKLMADRIIRDTDTTGHWTLQNYFIRTIDGTNETIKQGAKLDTILDIDIKDFGQHLDLAQAMDSFELNAYIDKQRERGADDLARYQLELHQRTSLPSAAYVLMLIGVSIASRKVRGGLGLHIVIGVVLAFVYLLFLRMFSVSAMNAGLHPLIAVWIPNILFTIIALYFYKKAQK
jgi:lipopolysaccharide export system permease protein